MFSKCNWKQSLEMKTKILESYSIVSIDISFESSQKGDHSSKH